MFSAVVLYISIFNIAASSMPYLEPLVKSTPKHGHITWPSIYQALLLHNSSRLPMMALEASPCFLLIMELTQSYFATENMLALINILSGVACRGSDVWD